MFSNLGVGEIIIIIIALLALFGSSKLPELAKGLGESSREIKKVKKEISDTINDIVKDDITTSISEAKGGDKSSD